MSLADMREAKWTEKLLFGSSQEYATAAPESFGQFLEPALSEVSRMRKHVSLQ
jgi:hypothetical protein